MDFTSKKIALLPEDRNAFVLQSIICGFVKESEREQQGFLQSELESKQRQMQHLIDALSGGAADDAFAEQVRKKVNELANQCEQLKMETEKAALNNAIYTDYESQAEAVKNALKKLKDIVLTAPVVEKRELLKSTIERIVWDGEQAHIFLLGE